MTELLTTLNQYSGAMLVVFAAAVTLFTVIFSLLMLRALQRMQAITNSSQAEPLVDVTYRLKNQWASELSLAVKNIGFGSAHNIQFDIKALSETPITRQLIKTLEKNTSLHNGLRYLSPSQEISSYLTHIDDNTPEKIKAKLQVGVSYENNAGKQYHNEYLIDLAELSGLQIDNTPPAHKIADNIEAIQKELKQLTSGFRRLKIDMYTEDDRQSADSSRKDYLEKMRQKHQDSQGNN